MELKAFEARIKTPLDLHFLRYSGWLTSDLKYIHLTLDAYRLYEVHIIGPENRRSISSVVCNSTVELSDEMVKIYEAGTQLSSLF